ncbi:MAG: hypothetical protein ACI9OJ_001442 [Myxococcota bacterium]|jgi:hypothetical protein
MFRNKPFYNSRLSAAHLSEMASVSQVSWANERSERNVDACADRLDNNLRFATFPTSSCRSHGDPAAHLPDSGGSSSGR